jgi:hypothetical protein
MVLLVGALYGVIVPFVLRPGPFVPPRLLVPAFGVAVCYFSVRFLFLPRPSYVQAKFSEWPEFCFAVAVAMTARNADLQLQEGDVSANRAPSPGGAAGADRTRTAQAGVSQRARAGPQCR